MLDVQVVRRCFWPLTLVLLGCAAAWGGCASPARPAPAEPSTHPASLGPSEGDSKALGRVTSTEPSSPREEKIARVAVTAPSTLSSLEEAGFSLAEVVSGSSASTTKELSSLSQFESIFRVLDSDLDETRRRHPLAKVTSMDGYRLFEREWLRSPEMRFRLIGVFNRIDRRVLYDTSCGEVRLLYRLEYATTHQGQGMSGRLPFQINVVFLVPDQDACRSFAETWHAPAHLSEQDEAAWLTQGPLSAQSRNSWSLKSVEVNLQSFRIQSRAHTTLGGHVEYILRVFVPGDREGELTPGALHNTPDVSRLKSDAALRGELLTLLQKPESLDAIDQGVFVIPEKFLANKAISVSPRALARPANRPFSALFRPTDFADVELSDTKSIRSPRALLRRLDGDSCTGCHQSRGTIAGAHHVGEDAADAPLFVSLFTGSSPHLHADLERRRHYLSALSKGEEPEEFRPSAETQGGDGRHGAPCGLGDPGFSHLTCEDGLTCVALEDQELGTCLKTGALGSACEYGQLTPGRGPHRDLISLTRKECDPGLVCHLNRDGFAQGDCESRCTNLPEDGACGLFTGADEFQNCLRHKKTAEQCAKEHVFSTGLRRCDIENPCRQDYVCSRTETEGVGACVPPYFVYPLRLDGYPLLK